MSNAGKCAVIMSFSRNPLLEEMYTEGIRKTVESFGFQCIRADDLEHNSRITDVVMNLIRNASFVIADMTEDRPNCYYELGYAHACGKIVIPTVYRSPVVHFDIQDYNFIVYTSKEDLALKLHKRIVHTIINFGKPYGLSDEEAKFSVLPSEYLNSVITEVIPIRIRDILEYFIILAIDEKSATESDFIKLKTIIKKHYGRCLEHNFIQKNGVYHQLFHLESPPTIVYDNSRKFELIFILDCSGSVTDDLISLARIIHDLIQLYFAIRFECSPSMSYIIHGKVAEFVDYIRFFNTRDSGGTIFSSAYKIASEYISKSNEDANIYVFQFSDGDNYDEDTTMCLKILKEQILPSVVKFFYVQIESPYGSGTWIKSMRIVENEFTNILAYLFDSGYARTGSEYEKEEIYKKIGEIFRDLDKIND